MAQQTQTFQLDELTFDHTIQPRVKTDPAVVKHYAEQMEAGETFDPIDVFKVDDGEKTINYVVDGFHRGEANRLNECDEVDAIVHYGTRGNAIRFAVKANAKHPKAYTNEDKRRAVTMLLELDTQQSNRAIARDAGVSDKFVAIVRDELESSGDVRTVRTRIDSTGREQPAHKPKTNGVTRESAEPDGESTSGETGKPASVDIPSGASETASTSSTAPAGAARSTGQAEQRKPKNGREVISPKDRKEAMKLLGQLTRHLQSMGLYEALIPHLNPITEAVQA